MLSGELREALQALAAGDRAVSAFEGWLVPRLPRLIQEPGSADARLVGALEFGLVELKAGGVTEDGFLALVRSLLEDEASVWVNYPPELSVSTSSSSSTETTSGFWAKEVDLRVPA